MAPRLVEPG
jgi:hypothetical protein